MDFLLKQRLVGAIVLVALGVIFIPMLLEDPDGTLVPEMQALPESTDPRSGKPFESFPPAGALSDEPETSVVMDDAQPEPAPEQADAPPAPAPERPSEQQQANVEQQQSAPVPDLEPAPPAADEVADPGPLGSWIVQVGSFSSQQNALVLRDKLRKDGFATQVESVQVDGKTHYRVRVGPFLERAEADRNQRQLSDKFSLKARVLSYP